MNAFIRDVSFLSAMGVVVLTAAIVFVLGVAAAPAFKAFGWTFFVSDSWNPVKDVFGALPAIYGTLVTSFLALLFALPVGFGIAFFLVELSPPFLVKPLRVAIELLAGIPSIVFGFWGLFVLAPVFQKYIQPFLIDTLGSLPLIGPFFEGPAFGIGILTAGVVLAIMILPFLTAFLTEVFKTVSPLLKESAYALGATRWEVLKSIVTPSTRASIAGGIMLALGRALGETMAVTFVIGNFHRLKLSLLAPGTSISASIANEFNEATTDLHSASLLALGLILFVITFIVLACGKASVALLARRERR
ncbi:MAG: phosphate ABC transporter permease subunit PstC [Alphaproteobacteria bacterium]|nr:phosphate ABC transporter permease subunit PstC [Alphaproteobacteria bacterium]